MLNFKYTKDNGNVSDRNLVVLRKPSTNYFGIDVTDEDSDSVKDLVNFLEAQKADLEAELVELGLRFKYRTFKEEGMQIKKG
jgi:hypothetical protein